MDADGRTGRARHARRLDTGSASIGNFLRRLRAEELYTVPYANSLRASGAGGRRHQRRRPAGCRHRRLQQRPRRASARRRRHRLCWRSPRRWVGRYHGRAGHGSLDLGRHRRVAGFDVSVSFDDGGTYAAIAGCTGLPATARQCAYTLSGPVSSTAIIRVTATDGPARPRSRRRPSPCRRR